MLIAGPDKKKLSKQWPTPVTKAKYQISSSRNQAFWANSKNKEVKCQVSNMKNVQVVAQLNNMITF